MKIVRVDKFLFSSVLTYTDGSKKYIAKDDSISVNSDLITISTRDEQIVIDFDDLEANNRYDKLTAEELVRFWYRHGFFSYSASNDHSAIITEDYLKEVALGNIEGLEANVKLGRSPLLNAGASSDLWNGGGTYTGQPENYTPGLVEVLSGSADDNAAGVGARSVIITGLKSTTSEMFESETIILNGTTPVDSLNNWWRVFLVKVDTAGANGKASADIIVRSKANNSIVFAVMPNGFNRSTIGAITVPFNRRMIIREVQSSIIRNNGLPGSATASLRIRKQGGVYDAKRIFQLQSGSPFIIKEKGGLVAEPLDDIKFRADQVSDNSSLVQGSFEWELVEIYDFQVT